MFRLLWFVAKVIFKLRVVLLSMFAGGAVATSIHMRGQAHSWGLLPGDASRFLPGDDIVDAPDLVETRSLIIDASPEQVWPWLVQMGYGRGGWYSFSPLDRAWGGNHGRPHRSADHILPEFGELTVGDIVPVHASGGFEVRVVDPEAALVLYLDDAMVRDQVAAATADSGKGRAKAKARKGKAQRPDEDMPPFQGSWAFILEAEPSGGTRLIERLRFHIELEGQQRRGLPMLGMGVFTLLRSQMLGIQRRAEAAARRSS